MNLSQIYTLKEALNASKDPHLDQSIATVHVQSLYVLLETLRGESGHEKWGNPGEMSVLSALILLEPFSSSRSSATALTTVYDKLYIINHIYEEQFKSCEIDLFFYKRILQSLVKHIEGMSEAEKTAHSDHNKKLEKLKNKCAVLETMRPEGIDAPVYADTEERISKNNAKFIALVALYQKSLSLTGARLDDPHKKASIERSAITHFLNSLTEAVEKEALEFYFSSVETFISTNVTAEAGVSHICSAVKNEKISSLQLALVIQSDISDLKKLPKLAQLLIFQWFCFELSYAMSILIEDNHFIVLNQGVGIKSRAYTFSSLGAAHQTAFKFFHQAYIALADALGVKKINFLSNETILAPASPERSAGAGSEMSTISPAERGYMVDLFKCIDLMAGRSDTDTIIASIPSPSTHRADFIDSSMGIVINNANLINTLKIFHPPAKIGLRLAINFATSILPLFDTIKNENDRLLRVVVARLVLRFLDYHKQSANDGFWAKPYDRTMVTGPTVGEVFIEKYRYFQRFHDAAIADYDLPPLSVCFAPASPGANDSPCPLSAEFLETMLREDEGDETMKILMAQSPVNKKALLHAAALASPRQSNNLRVLNVIIELVNRDKDAQVLAMLQLLDNTKNTIGHLIVAHQSEIVFNKYMSLLTMLLKRGHQSSMYTLLKMLDPGGNTFAHGITNSPYGFTQFLRYVFFINEFSLSEQQTLHSMKNSAGKTIWETAYARFGIRMLPQIDVIVSVPDACAFSFKLLLNTSFKTDLLTHYNLSFLAVKDTDGNTVLHCIASAGDNETIQKYLNKLQELALENPEKVLNILQVRNKSEETIGHSIIKNLHAVTNNCYIDLLHVLIKLGKEEQVDTILNATVVGKKSLKELMVESRNRTIKSACLTLIDPLLRAIRNGDGEDKLKIVLDGFKPDLETKNKAMLLAATQGNVSNCLYLLNNGAEINTQDTQGNTAQHLALQSGQIETAKALKERAIALSLNIEIRNRDRRLPDYYAPPAEKSFFNAFKKSTPSASGSTTSTKTTTSTTTSTTLLRTSMSPAPKVASAIRPIDKLHQEIKERQEAIKRLTESEGEVCRQLRKAQELMKEINERIQQILALGAKFNSKNLIQANIHINYLEKAAAPEIKRLEEIKAEKVKKTQEEKAKRKAAVIPAEVKATPVASTDHNEQRPTVAVQLAPAIPMLAATRSPLYSASFFPVAAGSGAAPSRAATPANSSLITSIRFAALGVKSQLAEMGMRTDVTPEIANAGLLYEVSQLFELLNQLPGHCYGIDRLRNHTGHQYSDLMEYDYSPKYKYPCSQILLNLAGAYDVDYLCKYAQARQKGQAVDFNTGPIDLYFHALKIGGDREYFSDTREASKVITSIQFAVDTLKSFHKRLDFDPVINKSPEKVANGSPALFSACKMAIVILDNALRESSEYEILQREIVEITKISATKFKQFLADLRQLRNWARHLEETVSDSGGLTAAIDEISPMDLYRLEPHIEFLTRYLEGRKSGATKSPSLTSALP